MSRKTVFKAELMSLDARLGGSHLTREARRRTIEKFVEVMQEEGFTHLQKPDEVTGKHLRAYVAARKADDMNVRSLQNEVAHLRSLLRAAGRKAVADSPDLTNKALGISGGNRRGTKTAMSDEQCLEVTGRAEAQGREGMACLIELERSLGLRGNEAIHARSDTLQRWKLELARDGRISVIEGTKGGRPRTVLVIDTEAAIAAVDRAILQADRQGGFLVQRANGKPAGGLKQARRIYHSWAHRSDVQPHSARYAFAQEQFDGYSARGFSEREALAAVSLDLGHGEGRGRWVKSAYMVKTQAG